VRRLLPAAALAVACVARGPEVTVRDAYAYQPVLSDVGAAYFTLVNHGGTADTLTGAEVQGALVAMFHEQVQDQGQELMRHVDRVPLAAGAVVALRPGGLHLMIEGFQRPPAEGDTLTITVHLARSGAIVVRAPVLAYGTTP